MRHHIPKSRTDEGLIVLEADVGIAKRRPRHREGMHAVAILKFPCHGSAVFTSTARHDHVVPAIRPPVLVAKPLQFFSPLLPWNDGLLLFRILTGAANLILIEGDAGSLVRDYALGTEVDIVWKRRELAIKGGFYF